MVVSREGGWVGGKRHNSRERVRLIGFEWHSSHYHLQGCGAIEEEEEEEDKFIF